MASPDPQTPESQRPRFGDLVPPLTKEERRALRESMQLYGFDPAHPIVVDEHGEVLFGHHRLEVARELGIEPVVVTRDTSGMTSDEVDEFVLTLEVRARRHLDPETRRRLLASKIAVDPEKSDRQIALEVGVDHKTVGRARREGEAVGKLPRVEVRTDSLGRRQPALRPSFRSKLRSKLGIEIESPDETEQSGEDRAPRRKRRTAPHLENAVLTAETVLGYLRRSNQAREIGTPRLLADLYHALEAVEQELKRLEERSLVEPEEAQGA